jgi:hypothetical protein
MPSRRTCAVPDAEPVATVTTICDSAQLTTVPGLLPSQTIVLPGSVPNPEPAIVTDVPIAPEDGDTLVMTGAAEFCVRTIV